jgi:hypothetical protein
MNGEELMESNFQLRVVMMVGTLLCFDPLLQELAQSHLGKHGLEVINCLEKALAAVHCLVKQSLPLGGHVSFQSLVLCQAVQCTSTNPTLSNQFLVN